MAKSEGSLYKKLHTIMGKLDTVAKRGEVSFGKTHYSYVTEGDILAALKPLFIEHGIITSISVTGTELVNDLTIVHLSFKLIDVDSGEEIVSSFSGQGQDKGDKGIYKAYTGAIKYFFMKTFMISTGDDPETVQDYSSNEQSNYQPEQGNTSSRFSRKK